MTKNAKIIVIIFLIIAACIASYLFTPLGRAIGNGHYILENSFIWKGNVPSDILDELPYI